MLSVDFDDLDLGFDVVIVGAGPAGCIAAREISEDFKVLLLDESSWPRMKACGGILVEATIEFLQDFKIPESVFEEPKILDLHYVDFNNNKENFEKKDFLNINRQKFDNWLFSLLNDKNNITFIERTKLIDFYFTRDRKHIVLVLKNNGKVRTIISKYLLSAEGSFSTIRNKMSIHKMPYYLGMQQLVPNLKSGTITFIFDDEITDFYSWMIPKKDGLLVGSAVSIYNPRESFNLFKQKIRDKYNIEVNGKISSALISRPLSVRDFFLGDGNILILGEAAGLITPSAGEGISFALKSGSFAAQAINKSSNSPMLLYKKLCKPLIERLTAKLKKARRISKANTRAKAYANSHANLK
ncbi:MAG TPA: hypothetical protein HA222_01900 [Candidatus Diapherotrites archaeon]|uniref:FAD-binding domain-containing protein n=1 Tax=Candidatus Iainarchaeum sp. TaxID=3101447 RepID=A0A7J4JWN4_9ARCH|nr:hypothetical protein [Candidatus Diapherotrites archaeon]